MHFRPYPALLAAAFALAAQLWSAELDAGKYVEHVKYLASPRLKGRGTGTKELDTAAGYIGKKFKEYGLKPAAGTYFQPFQVTTRARLGPKNSLTIHEGQEKRPVKHPDQFTPLNFSSAGAVTGAVVFAGYGITAQEYTYDDYQNVDVKDKIVMVLRREPQEHDDKSVFQGKVYTRHAQLDSKAVNAKMHGARAVILLTDASGELEKFGRTAGPANAGIPTVQVRFGEAEQWLAKAGKNLRQIIEEIDKDLKPRSFAMPESFRMEMTADVRRQQKTVRNVAGYWPGKTDEYIVIGAHYDHLGLGEQFSMAPSQAGTAVHPGADDNASGTAGVLELARHFASKPRQPRGILFLAFAGEELGLLGSSHYVNNPRLPLDKAVAMINMDMIGRIREGKVFIGGSGTGTTFKNLLAGAVTGDGAGLKFDFSEQAGYGSSDHTSFTAKQVPVLFFFSGLHSDYHKPTDTWDKIEAKAAVQMLNYVAAISEKLADGAERPKYVRVEPPKPSGAFAAEAAGGGRGYGAWFGSVPDFGDQPKGVKFADVTPGSPAAKAGLKGGDVLIEWDGKPVQNLYDFTYALRAKKPGEVVEVTILRGKESLKVKVTLEQRR